MPFIWKYLVFHNKKCWFFIKIWSWQHGGYLVLIHTNLSLSVPFFCLACGTRCKHKEGPGWQSFSGLTLGHHGQSTLDLLNTGFFIQENTWMPIFTPKCHQELKISTTVFQPWRCSVSQWKRLLPKNHACREMDYIIIRKPCKKYSKASQWKEDI